MKWDTISLGDLALRKGGSVDPKKHLDDVFELYSIPAFDAGAPEVVIGAEIGSSKKAVQPNDVMISRIVPHIRRACVVGQTNRHRQIASSEWIIFRSEWIWPQYLRWVLVGDVFHSAFMRTVSGVGGSLLRARPAEVFKISIPLPPLDEQKRIAGILDAADAWRAKRRESLVQLDTLLQSTFLDMFGDPVGNGWEIVAVEDVGRDKKGAIRTGPFGSQLLHSEFVGEGIRVLGIDNVVANEFREGEPRFITPKKYEQLRRYTVRPGDVLITIMGTCGRCAVVPDDIGIAINTKHLCCITLDREKCLPEFVHAYFLEHPIARRYLDRSAKGAIMSGLNMGIIKALPIPVPPHDLQQHFAALVTSVAQQKARQRAHLAELDTLFASLQSRVFRGDL